MNGSTASSVPRVTHFNCWRSSGVSGAAVAAQEEQRGQHVKDGVVGSAGLVEPVLQQAGGLARCDGPEPEAQQRQRRARRPAAAASGGGCS